MHKKTSFLRVFQKIAIFACIFCAFSAWADTTTCDINFTPVTGNSWQNGTPTPTYPVDVISMGNPGWQYLKKTISSYAAENGRMVTVEGDTYIVKTTSNTSGNNGLMLYFPESEAIIAGHKYYFGATIKGYVNFILNGTGMTASIQGSTTSFTKVGSIQTAITGEQTRFNFRTANAVGAVTYIKKPFCVDLTEIFGEGNEPSTPEQAETLLATSRIPVVVIGANGTQTVTSVYLDEPLRKVGEYADELRPDGTVIRRVGVKVLDGTENWEKSTGSGYTYWGIKKIAIGANSTVLPSLSKNLISTHFPIGTSGGEHNSIFMGNQYINFTQIGDIADTLDDWKSWVAQQYANGTPVTVYYPLATPVVEQIENWSCPVIDIKIATTKFVDDEFAAAEAKLATTVQTIESVVSRTIAQTGQIQVLQDTKQTRPDESCPANMKCLLVQDEDGTPHWYPIIEP